MTDTTIAGDNLPLGIGSAISETFSIFFKNILPVVILGFFPSLLVYLAGIMFAAVPDPLSNNLDLADPTAVIAGSLITTIVYLVMSSVTTALVVQLAYDSKLGRPVRLTRYFGPALRSIVPIVVLSIVVILLAGVASVAFIIPGLWVFAVFYVVTPAVVIERAGFGGMRRSAQLTKEYRWPLVGAFLLMAILGALLGAVGQGAAIVLAAYGGGIVMAVVQALIDAMAIGIGSIMAALIYARLREIKEGVTVDQIAAVFD
jgi:hypothetical protein